MITESLYVSQIVVTITESLHNDSLWFFWECFCLRIFLSIEMNHYNDYWTVITIHWVEALFLLFKLNFSWPIQYSLSFTKPKHNTVLIKLLYPSTSLGSCALVHLHVNPCTKTQTRQIVKFKIVLQIDKSKKMLSVTVINCKPVVFFMSFLWLCSTFRSEFSIKIYDRLKMKHSNFDFIF
jgi:hypothetical protein